MIKNKSGAWGEVLTARYLRDNKYHILTTNYICHFGEVDIIAEKGGTLHFVEVKTRDESTETRPADAVDENKQNRIALTANHFMTVTGRQGAAVFDVCEVLLGSDYKPVSINYISNAFEA